MGKIKNLRPTPCKEVPAFNTRCVLTLFHAACLCEEVFALLHVDEHVVAVVYFEEVVVEVPAAEIVVVELAEIVVVVLAETVAVEHVAGLRIAVVVLAGTAAVEEEGLAEIVVVLVGIGTDSHLEDSLAEHFLAGRKSKWYIAQKSNT
jgi:hypothetical protein